MVERSTSKCLDDYLGLFGAPLPARMLVFHGASGSGKSSQIELALGHPELAGLPHQICAPGASADGGQTLVVEEITRRRELAWLVQVQRRYRRVLVASHVPLHWFAPLRVLTRLRGFDLDRRTDKLRTWLDARGLSWSESALNQFTRHFSANYTDLELVLESTACQSLDLALAQFLRGSRIEHGPFQGPG